MAKSKPTGDPQIHLRPPQAMKDALEAEVDELNSGSGPKWYVNTYVLHLLETHPDRKKSKAKKGK